MYKTPLISRTQSVALPPRLFGPVQYYAIMAAYPQAFIDVDMRFDKRAKSVHRYGIADTRGPLELTVPIVRPEGATSAAGVPWSRVEISEHGRWWEVHRTALESAYGRTPFFEYYIDRISPLLAAEGTVSELVLKADKVVRTILGLETEIIDNPVENMVDYRRGLPEVEPIEYWQVRGDRFGFIGGLSILDLIFNHGPESPQILLEVIRKNTQF